MKIVYLLLSLVSCWCTAAADPSESKWQLSVALGAGVRTNPVLDNSNIPLFLIPNISYQDERFFIQNLDFGYTLYQTEQQQLNIILTPSYDQVFFNRWDVNNFVINSNGANLNDGGKVPGGKEPGGNNLLPTDPILVDGPSTKRERVKYLTDSHKRRMAGLAGFEYAIAFDDIDFQLQALQEVTQYYEGQELRAAMSKNISAGKHHFKFTLGANWQSDKTLGYFYGVTTQSGTSLDTYIPDAGASGLVRADWNYQINSNWSLKVFASYRRLSDSVILSPLITDKNVITAFAGGVYHF
jgi:MipA family protein